jgi:hypothetical protein
LIGYDKGMTGLRNYEENLLYLLLRIVQHCNKRSNCSSSICQKSSRIVTFHKDSWFNGHRAQNIKCFPYSISIVKIELILSWFTSFKLCWLATHLQLMINNVNVITAHELKIGDKSFAQNTGVEQLLIT